MGNLIHKNTDDRFYQQWYFGHIQRFKYKLFWIVEDHIWYETYREAPTLEIRKFIEKELNEDVLIEPISTIEKRTHKSSWDSTGASKLVYYTFLFEDEGDCIAFKLRFGEDVQDQDFINELKNKKTEYEQNKEKAEANGEYWQDRRN